MPGAVLEVLVAEGDEVEQNQTVVVMESMKMELLIAAPRDGVVRRVSVQAGQQVERGMRLLELELVLIEEHELTLPPAFCPWDWADRRRELWSRTQALKDARVERARAQLWRRLRRVLTLGLWRK